MESAAKSRFEPTPDLPFSRGARSQRRISRASEDYGAAAQRKSRTFTRTAAKIRNRIFKSRDKA
jgi:hypothetical protein